MSSFSEFSLFIGTVFGDLFCFILWTAYNIPPTCQIKIFILFACFCRKWKGEKYVKITWCYYLSKSNKLHGCLCKLWSFMLHVFLDVWCIYGQCITFERNIIIFWSSTAPVRGTYYCVSMGQIDECPWVRDLCRTEKWWISASVSP